ncbi:hypothetical protein B0H16DRAFT_1748176 [Mycena metata]|uniref:Ubiquitin-like protease family profile domain-containing protein n=1 Tax=Mycena metata TaxID=1033252 RepID=A0AAD7DYC8_9AGAR|nr:hypothetical protein B0H16DRAFT_1748176 [Mycena metata]
MAAFDRSEWISRGKSWKDVPKSVRKVCANDLAIPDAIASQILPDAMISIHALLDFSPPRPSPITSASPDTSPFFSKYSPSAVDGLTITRLRHLDMPSVKVIRKLAHDVHQAWLDGYTSVKCAHIPGKGVTYLPLWVVTFWNAVADIRGNVRNPWVTCRDWVKNQLGHRRKPDVRKYATDVTRLLGILPWNTLKRGLSDASPVHSLSRFLGTRIAADPDLAGAVRVEMVEFTARLTTAFRQRESVDYREGQGTRWLHVLGEDIFGNGERLITVAHLGDHNDEKHWVTIEVDGAETLFRYDDSFKDDVPASLRQVYKWWMSQHTASPIGRGTLPTSTQTDGHSCGMLAASAAVRAVYPTTPLMQQENIAAERLKMFSSLANYILDRIADEETEDLNQFEGEGGENRFHSPTPFTELARSAEFTFVAPAAETNVLKRQKGHPDGPTPASSPEKKRVRETPRERSPPPRLQFDAPSVANPVSPGSPNDVFGSTIPCTPSTSPVGCAREAAATTQTESKVEVMLSDVFGPIPASTPLNIAAAGTGAGAATKLRNLKGFFKVVTKEEKEAMQARDAELFRNTREEREKEQREEKYEAELRARENARERKRKSRANLHAERVAAGWVPSTAGRKRRKIVELEKNDPGPSASSSKFAEDSRQYRGFREASRKNNKPQGRKRKIENEPTEASRVNWRNPLIWPHIEMAVVKVGRPWSETEICRVAKLMAPDTFAKLTSQVIGSWIDKQSRADGVFKWKNSVTEKLPSGAAPGGQSTRAGILDAYPELCAKIKKHLQSLRAIGTPLSLIMIRGIMVATVRNEQPHLFNRVMPDGSEFGCSDSFVRKFLRNKMGWSERTATRAAQKIPPNHEEILRNAFLRQAFIIRDHAIPAELRVNTDQTQVVFQQGTKKTWNEKGAKQVATISQEEKRAFTYVPSISASGTILPGQAVFSGKSEASLPRPRSRGYEEAQTLGFKLEPSMGKSYWSTLETMQKLVTDIIAPYFDEMKAKLGLPPTQCSLWEIDLWSVQKGKLFRLWMKEKHPTIIICYVPGGCTGLFQPLNDVVDEATALLEHDDEEEANPTLLKLDTTIPTLRDRCIGWIVDSFHACNKKELILKAFELCAAGEFNCSQESLTSPAALAALRDLPNTNPALYAEFMGTLAPVEDLFEENIFAPEEENFNDESDVPVDVVIDHVINRGLSNLPPGFSVAEDGSVVRNGAAEDDELNIEVDDLPLSLRRPKRVDKKNTRYGDDWEEH